MSDRPAETGTRPPSVAQDLTHAVRNPLNSIVLNSTLLRELLDGGANSNGEAREARELVISIERQARRIQAALEEYLRHPS